jgi:type I restriction enzyme, S subunit
MEIKPGYKLTEVGVIPEDWQVKPLSGSVEITHGYGFQSQYFKAMGPYRLTTPGHFHETGGFRDLGEKQKFYDGPLPDGYLLNSGDLIVAMTEQTDGLLGSAAFIPPHGNFLHNQRLGKVKAISSDISIGYLYRVFNSNGYRSKVRETAAGTKVKHTSPSKLLEIAVPVPPTKAEQEAIAEALSDADALIESLEQLIAKKRHLKQGAMQELLHPKDGWVVKEIQDICDVDPENLGVETRPDYSFKYISLEEVDRGTLRGWTEQVFASAPSRARRRVKKGDVLVSTVRPNLQSHCLLGSDAEDLVCSTGFSVIRCKPGVAEPYYVFAHFFASFIEAQIEALVTGSNYPAVNSSDVKRLKIPLPATIAEQTAIATILTDMDAEITALEAKLAKARQLKQGMMHNLLTGRIRLV